MDPPKGVKIKEDEAYKLRSSFDVGTTNVKSSSLARNIKDEELDTFVEEMRNIEES